MSLEFLITSFIVVASPGTGVLITLAAGLSGGARASLVAAFGCTLGTLPHMIAAVSGLAALLHASASAFEFIRYLGVAYLLFMAWQVLKEKGALAVADRTPKSAWQVIVSAILANLLNPKLSIFFFAFLPQFVGPAETAPLLRMTELSLAFMLMTFGIFVVYGLFAASVRNHVISRPSILAWMRHVFAGAFVVLGARLAFSAR
ncbi:threonine/homoserine/homoserine lactone efflux protein [Neorhizobium galegae]|uniref:LysE family translocator n=1 Tax=Neorhizobium galegae TaxID=399 RepID=UPI00278A5EF5|nr:LysE family translocator [Neorhizobium galegae]MDQ0136527.1 threonine/homoserine/homoserine lactone efflux protein [Neorhizobium galegae]